jgi:hypothetical protein
MPAMSSRPYASLSPTSARPHNLSPPRRSSLWAAAVAIALVYVWVALIALDPAVLLSVDAAVKLLQAQALLASGWASVALPYPGAAIDSEGELLPFVSPFAFRVGSEWHGIIPRPSRCSRPLSFASTDPGQQREPEPGRQETGDSARVAPARSPGSAPAPFTVSVFSGRTGWYTPTSRRRTIRRRR